MSIHINDGLVWFCKEGLNGCSTMPISYAYGSAWLVLIALMIGILIGKFAFGKDGEE